MTDNKTTKSELEEYLSGKSPLSKLYQQCNVGEPGKDIDEHILNTAKQGVESHSSASSHRGYRWYLPTALAASLILAAIIVQIVPTDKTTETGQISESSSQNDSRQHSAAGRATPEILLENINNLLAEGKEDEAEKEYKIFTELFPNHQIDYKKYPHLKKLPEE
jgi:hypothetical protein